MKFQGIEVPYWDPRYVKDVERLPKPKYKIKEEKDVFLRSRRNDKLCVDIFRPEAEGKFPGLLAFSAYGKAVQSIRISPQPFQSLVFDHTIEAGDIEFFVSRGFVIVIADPHGIGKSEGVWHGFHSVYDQEDAYDIIEWIASQPWCNENVGMVGISYFSVIQPLVAAMHPPHLRAIMPYEFVDDQYLHTYWGGIVTSRYHMIENYCAVHSGKSESEELYDTEQLKEKIGIALKDPDLGNLSYTLRVLSCWPPRDHPAYLDTILHPLDGSFWHRRSAYRTWDKIDIPVYATGPWSPSRRFSKAPFKMFMELKNKPKVAIYERGFPELPFRKYNWDLLRWYSHWLLGIDTGIDGEPPIKIFVSGVNRYRWENEFPLKRTNWTKLYLRTFARLDTEPEGDERLPPDSFTHVPPSVSNEIHFVRYLSRPLTNALEITGPIALHLYVSIDTTDANLIAKLWDVYPTNQRLLLVEGSLKLSHRTPGENSTPWWPVHDHTKSVPAVPNEVYLCDIDMNITSHVLLPGHFLELDVQSMNPAGDINSLSPANYLPHRFDMLGPIPSSMETNYRLYHDSNRSSHLLLPTIRSSSSNAWIPLQDDTEG